MADERDSDDGSAAVADADARQDLLEVLHPDHPLLQEYQNNLNCQLLEEDRQLSLQITHLVSNLIKTYCLFIIYSFINLSTNHNHGTLCLFVF